MVKVKIGDTFATKDFRSGESNGKKWFLTEAKPEKGFDRITIFSDEICDGEYQEITAINTVTKSARKGTDKQGNEKWYDTYSINVTFKASEGGLSEFERIADEDMPF